jgi:amidase
MSRWARETRFAVRSEGWPFSFPRENSKAADLCVAADWQPIDSARGLCWTSPTDFLEAFVRLIRACLFLFCIPISVAAQNAPASSVADVVHFKGAIDNVRYVFGVAPPVARLRPGNTLDTNSLDCFGNGIQKPGDTTAMAKGDNPLTGPFFIEGAEPGDTLVVRILDLQVDGNQGVGAFSPGFGAINSTHYTPVLEKEPLAEKIWFYPIDHADNTATFQALDSNFKVKIPMHPFLGCIGVAPANGEARSSIVPAEFGGNMDAPEVSVGNTLYLPVNVSGALFYFGDGHAAMGDGEVAGSAIEVPMRARLQFDVVKGKRTGWPRLENEKEIMTTGIYRPVDDAVRIAFTELVAWIHADYGLSELDAYELLSKVGKIHLTEMVDPNYVVVASVEKKYLPQRAKGSSNRADAH